MLGIERCANVDQLSAIQNVNITPPDTKMDGMVKGNGVGDLTGCNSCRRMNRKERKVLIEQSRWPIVDTSGSGMYCLLDRGVLTET